MVDVADKEVSARRAVASGRVVTTDAVLAALRDNVLPKGDAIGTARLAGIMAAKRTSELIPLCHPIGLNHVSVDLEVSKTSIDITATTRTADRTGVEMEALTAVAVAGLTVIDMIKSADPAAELTNVCVQSKTGGKTGRWER